MKKIFIIVAEISSIGLIFDITQIASYLMIVISICCIITVQIEEEEKIYIERWKYSEFLNWTENRFDARYDGWMGCNEFKRDQPYTTEEVVELYQVLNNKDN